MRVECACSARSAMFAESLLVTRSFPAAPQPSTVPAAKKKRSNVQLIPLSEHKSPNNNETGISLLSLSVSLLFDILYFYPSHTLSSNYLSARATIVETR